MTSLLRALSTAPDDEAKEDLLDLYRRRDPRGWERVMLRAALAGHDDEASMVEAERWVA